MMQQAMVLKVLTPEGTSFEGPVEAVYLPGSAGRFEVLPGHAPIVSSLTVGELRWVANGESSSVAVISGAMMLKDNVVTVCVVPGK